MDEELINQIARIIDNWGKDSYNIPKDPRLYADQILTLIREAGYVRQEEDIDASAEILNKGIEIGKRMERERNKETK